MSEDATLDEFIQSEDTETDEMEGEGLREEGFLTLPYDWDISTVDEIAKEGSLVDGDWIESADMDEDGEIQLVQLAHIGEGQFKGEPDRFITKEFAEEEDCTILSEGDLIISRMQEPILRACLLPSFEQDSIMAVDIARLQEKKEWNRHFLKYLFNSRPVWKQGIAWASGTTRKRISRKNIEKLRLPTPPLEEQRKIATVLYNVDQAIQKTEEIIEQSERVRAGITQDVFTTGYYTHDEYNDVRLGPVNTSAPTDWDIKSIPDYFEIIDGDRGKNYPSGSELSDQGHCLFLNAKNVTEEGMKFDETEFITKEKDGALRKGKLERGDIIMTTRGTVGNFGLYDENVDYENMRINSGMVILRPKENLSSIEYYYHHFRSGIFQRQINGTSYGTAQPQTSVTDIKKMKIFEPSEDEKEQIAELIADINLHINAQKDYKNNLLSIKQGLMQDLLSGTVRTTNTNIEVPDEIAQHG